jgi:hypothetical protein
MAEKAWGVSEAVVSFRRREVGVGETKHTFSREYDNATTDYLAAEKIGICQVRSAMLLPDVFVDGKLRALVTESSLLHRVVSQRYAVPAREVVQ